MSSAGLCNTGTVHTTPGSPRGTAGSKLSEMSDTYSSVQYICSVLQFGKNHQDNLSTLFHATKFEEKVLNFLQTTHCKK